MKGLDRFWAGWLAAGLGAILAAGGFSGCDQGRGLDELSLTPDSVILTPGSNFVDFAVDSETNDTRDSLALPLEWSVSNPSLGTILYESGWTARYRGNAASGENTITVEDQFGQKGHAVVKHMQDQYVLTLTATPNPIPAGSNTTTIVVSGGVAPYRWGIEDKSLGEFIWTGGNSAAYRSKAPGSNVVHVRDANRIRGLIVIVQED